MDTIIEVRQPSKTPDDNPEALLLGHSNNVCCLDVDPSGKLIVSGGWDGQARVWSVGKWECDGLLEGHEGSVWAVLAWSQEMIITGKSFVLYSFPYPDIAFRAKHYTNLRLR